MKPIKTFLLLVISVLSLMVFEGCDSKSRHIKQAVNRQLEEFPATTLPDLYKGFFQDNFGPGHIVSDTAAARAFILRELAQSSKYDRHYFEPAGRGDNFYRVSLAVIADSIVPLDLYCDAFYRSVKDVDKVDVETWKEEWSEIYEVIKGMKLNLPDMERDAQSIDSMLNAGGYASHHSERYNRYHHPHYRLIRKEIFFNEIKPLIDSTRVFDVYDEEED
ncbi:MAG: hypothetical protein J1E99_08875 [Muribaculaceae bacterium]|nr:hypothetical protein [Muribaculaceae bacterium]